MNSWSRTILILTNFEFQILEDKDHCDCSPQYKPLKNIVNIWFKSLLHCVSLSNVAISSPNSSPGSKGQLNVPPYCSGKYSLSICVWRALQSLFRKNIYKTKFLLSRCCPQKNRFINKFSNFFLTLFLNFSLMKGLNTANNMLNRYVLLTM